MAVCPNIQCARPVEHGARFCTYCGAAVSSTDSRNVKLAPQLPLPLLVGDRYELFAHCGGGGMAQVYRALDKRLQRDVAVKVINPALRDDKEFDARFQREVNILSQLSDPHIVVAHDFAIDPTFGPYLVMEYLRGQSLRERMRRGRLPLAAGLQIGAQVLLALQHAHHLGIVHRDIKPDNLFLVDQPNGLLLVRVLDFGIARIYRDDGPKRGSQPGITLPGSIIGTPKYMAPEQNIGGPIDARTDIYSLAVVLYEAWTGQLPTPRELLPLRSHIPQAPAALDEWLASCLQVNPAYRPNSATDAFGRLIQIRDDKGQPLFNQLSSGSMIVPALPIAPARPSITALIRRVPRRNILLSALVGLLALGGLWVGYEMILRSGPLRPPAIESVLGISIGASKEQLVAAWGQPDRSERVSAVDPDLFGHVLNPADWPQTAEVLIWDHQGCAVIDGGQLVALISTSEDARSGASVRIGDREPKMEAIYGEPSQVIPFRNAPASKVWGLAYRYDTHGIGFELQNHRVTSITLFPARANAVPNSDPPVNP